MSTRTRIALALFAAALVIAPAALLGQVMSQGLGLQHPNLERGFKPEKAYEVGDIDHVNLFNGNLSLTLPIGPTYRVGGRLSYRLSLVYNAKLWDWERWCVQTAEGEECTNVPTAHLDANAGFGFQLDLGRLVPPGTFPRNPGPQWLYLSPDGGEHTFYDRLHPGDTAVAGIFYSRDSTYLRLRQLPSTLLELSEPGGIVRQFDRFGRLVHIRDHMGNFLQVTRAGDRWTLSDGFRTHTIDFESRPMDGRRAPLVSTVTLAAFGGTRAVYTFHYTEQKIDRPCPFTAGLTSHAQGADVSLLTAVTLPDGTAYRFSDYRLTRGATLATCTTMGTVGEAQLPTYGTVAWEYGTYRFPNAGDRPGGGTGCTQPSQCGTPEYLQQTPGVTKRLMKRGSNVEGTWTYQPHLEFVPPDPPDNQPVQMTNTVIDPMGHKTIHYFSTFPGGTPDQPAARQWHYGLPFTVRRSDGSGSNLRYLSRERFQSTNSKRQSFWVRYEEDGGGAPPPNNPDTPPHSNQRVASEMTRWHHELNAEKWIKRSQFDGLGHYRNAQSGGSGYEAVQYRTDYTHWNPNGRPATHALWVLDTFDESWSRQGATTAKRSYCFGGAGFLNRVRIHAKNDGATSADDIVVSYANDGRGNTKGELYFGGDGASLATSTNLCGIGVPSDRYRIEHTYQYGSLETSTYTKLGGEPLEFKSLHLEIDASTGLAKSSRDTALLYTQYDYDTMGRLTKITAPTGGADVTYAYTLPSGSAISQRGWVTETHAKGAAIYQQRRYVYDHWGRLWRTQENMPDTTWSTIQTNRNILGWTTAVSVPTTLADPTAATLDTRWTKYFDHDVFGRPLEIQPPDDNDAGGNHDTEIRLDYNGDQRVRRTVRVRTNTGPAITLSDATTEEHYDRFGRLIRVTEPAAGAKADYTYDVADRLIEAKLVPVGGGTSQTRTFVYDQRGFLTRARHPEKSDWVDYEDYDPRGHAWTVKDAGHRLFYKFDRAGRPTEIKESFGADSRVLEAFTYCTANDGPNKCLGKLASATRNNHVNAPWTGNPLWTVPVTETYFYADGRGQGRLSTRNTTVQMGGTNIAFTQRWDYDPQGRITSTTYPCRAGVWCGAASNPARTVTRGYRQGRLRNIPGYANNIAYHPSGIERRVTMPNGLEIDIDADPWGLPRPRDIRLTMPDPEGEPGARVVTIALGQHTYDGAGNLVQRGGEHYQLDRVNRLRRYTQGSGGYQDYRYDAFGNVTQITTEAAGISETRNIAVQAATNRLTGAALYDSRGNLTAWGGETYSYDGLNKMRAHDGFKRTYLYTPDGERIYTLHWGEDPREVWTLRDLDHTVQRIWETDGVLSNNWIWKKDYVYRAGTLHAALTDQPFPTGKQYLVTDHLGSPRMILDAQRNILEAHHLFGYGEQLAESPGAFEAKRFTGHERDWNDGTRGDDLDYMHARHYSPHLARFWSVDPAEESIDPKIPQSWNRYSYGLGNPVKYIDPDGEAAVFAGSQKWLRQMERNATIRKHLQAKLQSVPKIGGVLAAVGDAVVSGFLPATAEELNDQMVGVANPLGTVASRGTSGLLTRATSLLKPGGKLIGKAGSSSSVRFIQGTIESAEVLFRKLSKGGRVISREKHQTTLALGNHGTVTFRTVSRTKGVIATIDVRLPGVGVKRVKFVDQPPE